MTTQSASIKVDSARKRRITSKPVRTVADPAVAWAEKLWARLEANLFDVQETIIAIIETRAWEPLGYESFAKAWVDRIMSKVPISTELRPHVVYELFSSGLTAEQVAGVVDRISPESARWLKQQKDHGVPPNQATTVVRQYNRRLPDGEWGFLHLRVEKETLREWKRLAKENDLSMTEFALMAVETAFGELS